MDPLSALREFTIRGDLDKIVRVNDEFRFGSSAVSFPCSAPTAFRSKQGNLYTLDTLLFFVRHHHARHTDYLQLARTQAVPAVTFIDRKPLLDYLSGRISSSDSVDDLALSSAAAVEPLPARASDPPASETLAVDFMELIRACERPLKDREALLECKGRNFHAVLAASAKREEERLRAESQQRKDGLVAKSRLMSADEVDSGADGSAAKPKMLLKGGKMGEGVGVPIILVPSAFQTLITMYNVKEFLEDGVFVATDVKVKQMKGPKPDCVTVQKKFSRDRDRVVTAYEVRDKPSALKPEDWDRVVAVFVLGKDWQFKDWPFKDHVEIFNKSKCPF